MAARHQGKMTDAVPSPYGPTWYAATVVAAPERTALTRDIDVDIWYALYAPAETPRDIVAKLNAEVNGWLKDPATIDTLTKQGLQPTGGSPEDLATLTRSDLERWAKAIREAKIQPD